MGDWKRSCTCGKVVRYTTKRAFQSAANRNALCNKCSTYMTNPVRLPCSVCNLEVTYTTKSGFIRASKNDNRKCTECTKKASAARRVDRRRQSRKEWRVRNPGYHTQYWYSHKDNITQRVERWRKDNWDSVSAKSRMRNHVRRALYKQGDASWEYIHILLTHTSHCSMCGVEMNTIYRHPDSKTIDHITPLALGGLHNKSNIRVACWKCNISRPRKYLKEC